MRARLVMVLALALLAGCGSTPKLLENRAACTLDGTELHVLSKWGPISIGTRVADADAATVCKKP
jgi:uncharacterized protein YcfL